MVGDGEQSTFLKSDVGPISVIRTGIYHHWSSPFWFGSTQWGDIIILLLQTETPVPGGGQ